MKKVCLILVVPACFWFGYFFLRPQQQSMGETFKPFMFPEIREEKITLAAKLKSQAAHLQNHARKKGFSTRYAFLVDMSLPSGKYRFFVYDLERDTVIARGLVAHGSCNEYFLEKPRFSNTRNQGCSSLGMYQVGYAYQGSFGKAYKLFGLDSTNSNAFRRAVVLHAFRCVPDEEVHPDPICNSLGCPMVSPRFLKSLYQYIDQSPRPVLLWITHNNS